MVLSLSPTVLACAYWGLSQALSWRGAFLIKGLGLAQGSIGLLGALPAGASVVVIFAAGWYSQRLLARGVSSRVARGLLGGGCVALDGMALAVMPYVPGIPAKIALATIGIAVPSVINVISHTVVSELTPVAQRVARLRHRDRHLGRAPRALHHGQRCRDGGDTTRRLQYRLHDLRRHHACGWPDRHGVDPARARRAALDQPDRGCGGRPGVSNRAALGRTPASPSC
jgi:hypothetical protein